MLHAVENSITPRHSTPFLARIVAAVVVIACHLMLTISPFDATLTHWKYCQKVRAWKKCKKRVNICYRQAHKIPCSWKIIVHVAEYLKNAHTEKFRYRLNVNVSIELPLILVSILIEMKTVVELTFMFYLHMHVFSYWAVLQA